MEPNHLKSNEIVFELLCRGLQPQDNQMLRRAQLRGQLRKERNEPSVSFIQPYDDYEKNVSQIEESLTDLWDLLNSENVTSLVCTRVNTRLLHLENRINLLKPSGKEQISKKNDFNTQLLTLQGLLIEHSESQIENDLSKLNMSAMPSNTSYVQQSTVRSVPVYKWAQICPQCEHQFTRSDNLKRHLKNSCKGVALNKVMKPKFENEAQFSSKKKSNDNKKDVIVNVRCNECQEDVLKAHYRGHLRSNRHKINACRFIDDEGVQIIQSTFQDRLMSYKLSPSNQHVKEFYRVSKRGKIYNKYANMKSTFKSAVSGHIASSKTKSKETETRHEKNFEPEDNAESCIRCMKYDNLSVAEFDQCWKACARYRLTQIKKLASTKSIMETWPFYKAPSGYCLIDIDYEICFDDSDGLILNWKKYFDILVKFLSSSGNVKDKKIKGLVEKVRDAPDLPENGKNAAIFWALHGYFVPTKLIVVKKDDKKINT
ncbi:hypothetical protein RN001_009961 [Aquatica leii]|uniref:Uncharacterized protein n=1 Tax=Aquatica leii TaxID=1421715 RepID=A0AAN7SQ47_9COLE|nr:hypothetical protein RN001_009961 [Aquatica leii]